MKKWLATSAIFLFGMAGAQASEGDRILLSIEALFSAISMGDTAAMKEQVSSEFILLEHGEIWDIVDLIEVVSATKATRANYFSVIRVGVYDHLAIANYWNKANFQSPNISEDVIWLESAVLKSVDGDWELTQMHSTRLPAGTTPENVVFTPNLK